MRFTLPQVGFSCRIQQQIILLVVRLNKRGSKENITHKFATWATDFCPYVHLSQLSVGVLILIYLNRQLAHLAMAEEEQVPLYVHGNNEDDNLSLSSNVSVTSISRMKQGMATGAAYIAKRLLPTIQEDPSNIAKLPEYLNVITKTSEELTALAVEDLQTNSVYVEAKRNSLKQADMIAVHVKTYESFEKEKMELEAKLAKVVKTMKAAKDKADMHQHAKDYFDKIVSKHCY